MKIIVKPGFELKLDMLGTGNAFSTPDHKGHSRGIIKADNTLILVDAGEGTTTFSKGYDFTGITHVIFCVTHLHPDHSQELLPSIFELLFCEDVDIIIFSNMDVLGTDDEGIIGSLKLQGLNAEFKKQYPEEMKRLKFMSASTLFPIGEATLTEDALYLSSFRQDHGIIDACGFVFIYFNKETRKYDILVYSGDANTTARLNVRLLDIFKLKPNIRSLTIYHEASIANEHSKVHTNINKVVDLAFDLEFNLTYDIKYCMYLYHLPDTVNNISDIMYCLDSIHLKKLKVMDMSMFKIADKT